ncbi:hypothetical protein [Phyllobacterium chamaecytisi]|uniref:hypothetical protein n=1 Tax=Phyllobacterium chamaecytisi TaxID=2876082 RepID=UPI001CCF8772|nr:hypothetical protein [Phyllobacterium sp. KW56]MBZ9606160.1 hypothetical protein [Phyllobacterium sp. KW56]
MDRKLVTILAADVVGYSKLMEHEQGTFEDARKCSNPKSPNIMAASSSLWAIFTAGTHVLYKAGVLRSIEWEGGITFPQHRSSSLYL